MTLTTKEMTEDDIEQSVFCFNQNMVGHHITKGELMEKYQWGCNGFSYHALCYDENNLVGFISAIPYRYQYKSEEILVGLTCDIVIKAECRNDFTLFAKLYNKLKEICLQHGIVCFLGVANQNAYTYSIRILRCKELMTLPYWILPVKAGNILKKKGAPLINMFSLLWCYLSLYTNHVVSSLCNTKKQETICKIIEDDIFLQSRLSESNYVNVADKNIRFTYRITEDEGVKCAYVLRFVENEERSYKSLCRAVKYILQKESVDMVMFNGTLNLKQGLLIKTPQKFEPRKIHLTVNFLTKEYEKQYAEIMEPNGIDFTLLNLDVR